MITKLSRLILLVVMAGLATAQIYNNTQIINSSGAVVTVPNTYNATTAVFGEVVSGSPTSATVTVSGCTSGNSCTTLDTKTYTGSTQASRTVTSAIYDHYSVTATWSGGTGVSVTINTSIVKPPVGSYTLPIATTSTLGGIKPDGTTLTVNSTTGVASAASSGALLIANNLSDLASTTTARTNLGLGTAATQANTAFLQTANNLSDVTAATARTNLGLGAAAVQANSFFLQTANNLSDVTAATARTNLGLGTAATQSTGTFLQTANNLSDVTAATARTNLGLATVASSGSASDLGSGTLPHARLPTLLAADIPASLSSTTTVNGTSIPSSVTLTQTIASGTSALGTSAISSGTCASVVTTSATGTATTDVIDASFNADPTGVTGYAPTTNGMLTIIGYPTANNVNWKVCNNTSASITPGAITLNWRVPR